MAKDTTPYETQIVAYLDRIVRAIRRMENEAAVTCGLNPLQLRILQFLLSNSHRKITVGFAAEELEVSEPTISDSLRALETKKLIIKTADANDRRIKHLQLTARGKKLVGRLANFSGLPLATLDSGTLERLSSDLHQLVAMLFEKSLLKHARICRTCAYFSPAEGEQPQTCRLLKKQLRTGDLQSDCHDHIYARDR